jgi:DNA polymerase III delta prime subunit
MKKKSSKVVNEPIQELKNPNLIGHATQRAFFNNLHSNNRLPSTLLLTGPGGVGKSLVAKEIALSLFCEKSSWGGCKTCPSCLVYMHGNTPDLYQVNFDDHTAAAIENVRELLYSLQLKSFAGKNRVVIFNNAHLMSVQVTNLLLKQLEEPRPNTFFILVSSSKARMLPTLLSRCQTTHFDALSISEIEQVLVQNPSLMPADVSISDRKLLLELADGSLENLASLSQELPRAKSIEERIENILTGDTPEATKLSSELAKDKDNIERTLRLIVILLRTKLLETTDLCKKNRLAHALQNAISSERLALDRNLAPSYLFSLMMTQLLPLPRGAEPLLIDNVVV